MREEFDRLTKACIELQDKTRFYEVPLRMEGKEVIRPTLHLTQDSRPQKI